MTHTCLGQRLDRGNKSMVYKGCMVAILEMPSIFVSQYWSSKQIAIWREYSPLSMVSGSAAPLCHIGYILLRQQARRLRFFTVWIYLLHSSWDFLPSVTDFCLDIPPLLSSWLVLQESESWWEMVLFKQGLHIPYPPMWAAALNNQLLLNTALSISEHLWGRWLWLCGVVI